MFKIVALLGVVAGGAAYGVYTQTDLFGCKSGTCSVAKQSCCQQSLSAGTPSCCAVPCPDCSLNCDNCCDVCSACCSDAAATVTAAVAPASKTTGCCSAKATKSQDVVVTAIAAKAAACCVSPCSACADVCDACALCAIDCGACCAPATK